MIFTSACELSHQLNGMTCPIRIAYIIDRSVIRSLKTGPLQKLPQWLHQIQTIDINGVKAEIEAAYRHSGYGAFVRDLARRINEGLYL